MTLNIGWSFEISVNIHKKFDLSIAFIPDGTEKQLILMLLILLLS